MYRLCSAALFLFALCGTAHAQWSTSYASDPPTGRKACHFGNKAETGQAQMDGFLPSDGESGALRVNIGIFGGAVMDTPPGGVTRTAQTILTGLTFAFDEGTRLRVSGEQMSYAMYASIPPDEVVRWTHGFTAGHKMTVTGADGLVITMPLSGTSRLVDNIVKCVSDNMVIGLPKPFALSE